MEEKTLEELFEESDSVKKPLQELFDVVCMYCRSKNVCFSGEHRIEECGCGTCRFTRLEFYLGLKCHDCGQAKILKREVIE